MNTQQLNDEMFGSKKNYVKPIMFAAVVIILLIIAMVIATPSHAMGIAHRINFVSYTDGCTPYTHGMVLQSYANVLNHASCNGEGTQNTDNTDKPVNSVPAAVEPIVDIPVENAPVVTTTPEPVDNTPAPVVSVVKEDKPKCNNGEGNGSEGCSPAQSANANNDENQTTPKEDKSTK